MEELDMTLFKTMDLYFHTRNFGEEPEHWFDRFSRLDVIMQLVSTMVYVQKQKIVHGDLKPHNIMGANLEDPSRPLTIKIIDWDG